MHDQPPIALVAAIHGCDGSQVRSLPRTVRSRRIEQRSCIVTESDDLRVVDREALPRLGVLDGAKHSLAIGNHPPAWKDVNRVGREVVRVLLARACCPPEDLLKTEQFGGDVHGPTIRDHVLNRQRAYAPALQAVARLE
jgi:hypothetical protein